MGASVVFCNVLCCFLTTTQPKGRNMKKIVSVLFVLASLMSNMAFASDCHPDEHKDDHGKCVKK
jgi:hypothetical protein